MSPAVVATLMVVAVVFGGLGAMYLALTGEQGKNLKLAADVSALKVQVLNLQTELAGAQAAQADQKRRLELVISNLQVEIDDLIGQLDHSQSPAAVRDSLRNLFHSAQQTSISVAQPTLRT